MKIIQLKKDFYCTPNSINAFCVQPRTVIVDRAKKNTFAVVFIINGFPNDLESYDTYDEACDALKSIADELGELPL